MMVAMLLVNFFKRADRRAPSRDVPARPDRSSSRDMMEPLN